MRQLPQPPRPAPGDTLQGHGLRILTFVLTTGVTATVTDIDLELADHAYPLAIVNPDLLPAVREQFTTARRQIMDALKYRRFLAAPASFAETAPTLEPKPNLGPMAPLKPQPHTRPPAPVAADLAF